MAYWGEKVSQQVRVGEKLVHGALHGGGLAWVRPKCASVLVSSRSSPVPT